MSLSQFNGAGSEKDMEIMTEHIHFFTDMMKEGFIYIDDEAKINYQGMEYIFETILKFILEVDKTEKIIK